MATMTSARVTADSRVSETIARWPGTAPVFLQHGRMFVAQPPNLYAVYPGLTVADYAARNGVDLEWLLRRLDAAAETDDVCRPCRAADADGIPQSARPGPAPVAGPIGYTGAYRDPHPDVETEPYVAALEARGPE